MFGEYVRNWVPVKLFSDELPHVCRWMFVGNKRFTEPFFDESITWCKQFQENNKIFKPTSTLEMLPLWSSAFESLQPTAFIFHVSRCGSTLLSQLLSLDPRHIVLSEVPFLDEAIRLPFNKANQLPVKESNIYFSEAIRFYSQKRNGDETHLFLKLDSWHLLFYERIRSIYPAVPFIILYRSPADIIRSQQRSRGMQSVPGLIEKEIFGFSDADFTPDLDVHMSRVLEKYFSQILQIIKSDSNFILLNYDEGILEIAFRLLSTFGIPVDDQFAKKMQERMEFDGKRPSFFFKPEVPADATADFIQEAQHIYQQVEKIRKLSNAIEHKLQQHV